MIDIIEDIINKNALCFGEFYRPYLVDAELKFKEFAFKLLKGYDQEVIINLKNKFIEELYAEIFSISLRTFIVEIHLLSNEHKLKGKDQYERYQDYYNMLRTREYRLTLEKKYPIMFELIKVRGSYRINLWRECIERLISDKEDIQKVFAIDISKLTAIVSSNGDSHCNGHRVMIIEADNSKIVYKPHSMRTDKIFENVLHIINKKTKQQLRMLKCIDKENYGWQEYIEKCAQDQKIKLDDFYYKAGMLLAVSNCMLCTDLHNENVIASNNQFIIVDFETLTHNTTEIGRQKGNTAIEELFSIYNNSVLGSMLLPNRSTFSPLDFDIGGMSSQEGQFSQKFYSFKLQNLGTDEIGFVKRSSKTEQFDNKIYIDGKVVNLRTYREQFLRGFQYEYKVIMDSKDEIIEYLKTEKAPVRQVFRPTAVYTRILDAVNYPYYFEDGGERLSIIKKVQKGFEKGTKRFEVSEQEVKELLRGDVPYIYNCMDSKSVWINGKEIKDFYEKTIIEIIEEHLNEMNKENCEFQSYFINLSLSTLKVSKDNDSICYRYKLLHDSDSILECAEKIAGVIDKRKVETKDKKECIWFMNSSSDKETLIDISNLYLYNFGGIALFYMYLWKATGKQMYFDIAKAQLNAVKKRIIYDNYSFFAGAGSSIYLNYELYKLTQNKEYKAEVLSLYTDMKRDKIITESLDVIAGISGTIIMSCNIYYEMQEEIIFNRIKIMCEELYKAIKENKYEKMTGLAHGFSGIEWAMLCGGVLLNEEKYILMALELIKEENSYFSLKQHGWKDLREEEFTSFNYWCHGSGGILISRIKMYEVLKGINTSTADEIRKIVQTDIDNISQFINQEDYYDNKKNYGLCHGFMGQIDVLLEYNKFTKDKAKRMEEWCIDKMIDEFTSGGIYTGNHQIIEDYSFMNGLAGIGYELLRINKINCPCILAFEI